MFVRSGGPPRTTSPSVRRTSVMSTSVSTRPTKQARKITRGNSIDLLHGVSEPCPSRLGKQRRRPSPRALYKSQGIFGALTVTDTIMPANSARTPNTRSPINPPIPPSGRDVRPVLPGVNSKRIMKQRHPFDIYQDQCEALQLALEERTQGGAGSMSAMVRQAPLDAFIETCQRS